MRRLLTYILGALLVIPVFLFLSPAANGAEDNLPQAPKPVSGYDFSAPQKMPPEIKPAGENSVGAPMSISEYDFPGLKKKISLDIRSMEIVNVLKFLAIEGDLNIVASSGVAGTVNLLINNVAIGDALEIIISMNKLACEVKGNVIMILTNEEYKTKYGVNFFDQRKTKIYQLKYATPSNVGAMLGNTKSEIGKIIFDDSVGTLIVIDTPAKIEEADEVIAKSELPTVIRVLPTETRTFELKSAKVEDVKDEITKALTANVGTIRVDKRTNTMVVTDLPLQLAKIEKLIEAFDRKTREVFIEAKIVEVTLSDTFKWGIDWTRIIHYSYKGLKYTFTPQVELPLDLTDAFGKLTVSSVSTSDLSAVLEALNTMTDTRLLSSPHLTVEEGKEASIKVIEKQPYQEETTVTAEGGTTTSSKTYQWVDVGVTLNVTPSINDDGFISLLIKPEVSSISTWYGGDAQAAGAVPVVKTAVAETKVTIKDGVSIIIAGLIKDGKTKTVNKIPLFGDIPLVGKFFQSISDDIRRTETIVFLTPKIVTGEEPFLLDRAMQKDMRGLRE